jgi:methylated-DNA-[protein]-cysteine S-methyltransferase
MPSSVINYAIFETKAGWMGVAGSFLGLVRTTLPQKTRILAISSLNGIIANAHYSHKPFENTIYNLQAYFAGLNPVFTDKLNLSSLTSFQRAVLDTTRLITYGHTASYGDIAKHIGKPAASRAVGGALGRNPLPIIIPCHRVIASNGTLCGFAGGQYMKEYLLNLEQ